MRLGPFLILATLVLPIQPSGAQTAGGATQGPGAAAIPRAPDGKPDLSGIWQVLNTAAWDIQDHSAQKGIPGGQGVVEGNEIPYQPSALAKKKENYEQRATLDPETKCYLPGLPRLMYMPFPFQIIQKPNELTFLHEYVHTVRYIFTNGAPHPPGQIDWWLGDSRGRWEGDTLVVDTTGTNGRARPINGYVAGAVTSGVDTAPRLPASDQLHVVERIRLAGDGQYLENEITVNDPKTYLKPWTVKRYFQRRPDIDLQEYACTDNSRRDAEGQEP